MSLNESSSEETLLTRAMVELEKLLDMKPTSWQGYINQLHKNDPNLATLVSKLSQASNSCTLPLANTSSFLTEMLFPNGYEIGKYVTIKPMDAGASGTVYEVVDQNNTVYALKIMHPGFIGSTDQNRFEREICVLSKLSHTNIPRLIDYGGLEDTSQSPWFVMEYVEGATGILGWCTKTSPSEKTIINMMLQVLSAVDYAHKKNIIHRDISPSNILVDKENKAHIIDFGLAILHDDVHSRITGTHATLGTIRYISPEVVREGAKAAVPASDQYAIASVLKAMFELRSLSIDGKIGAIITKARSNQITQRYRSVDEMRLDMIRAINNKRTSAENWQARELVKQTIKKHPFVTLAIGTLCLAMFILPSLFAWQTSDRNRSLTKLSQNIEMELAKVFKKRNKESSLSLASVLFNTRESTLGKLSESTIAAIIQLADIENDHNLPKKAELHATEALSRLSELPTKNFYLLTDATNTLGLARHNQNELIDARKHYNKAFDLADRAGLNTNDNLYIAILNNDGALLRDEKQYDEAIARFKMLGEIYTEKYGNDDLRVLGTEWYSANITRHAGNHNEAAKLYDALVQRGKELLPESDWHVGWWLLGSGRNMIEARRYEKAIPLLTQAREKLIYLLGADDDWVCKANANLIIAYRALGNNTEASKIPKTKCSPVF